MTRQLAFVLPGFASLLEGSGGVGARWIGALGDQREIRSNRAGAAAFRR